MKEILTRTATGLIYIALIITATMYGPLAFLIIFGLILAQAIYEMLRICNKSEKQNFLTTLIDIIGGVSIFVSTFLQLSPNSFNITVNALLTVGSYLLFRAIIQLYDKNHNPIKQLGASAISMLFTTLPFVLMSYLYVIGGNPTLLACFIFIWINDTGAFCVGSMIGKKRLFERISPKKSWEGFFGGMVFNVVAAVIFGIYFKSTFNTLDLYGWVILSIIITVFATWGDLFESMLKRSVGVKDSGNLLPGHGGILDRIDSLLMVVSGAVIFISIYNRI